MSKRDRRGHHLPDLHQGVPKSESAGEHSKKPSILQIAVTHELQLCCTMSPGQTLSNFVCTPCQRSLRNTVQ